MGRLVSIAGQQSDNSAINSFTYNYDAAGQRIQETTLDYQQNFTYDAQRELTQATPAAPTAQRPAYTYAYDGIGNRQTASLLSTLSSQPATTSYTPNSVNQYTSILNPGSTTPVSPSYDLNGNTTSLQGMTLRYDEENRLVEVSDSTHDSIYTYDGLGRRVEAKVSTSGNLTSDILFVYDGRRVIEEWAVPLSTLGSGLSTPTLLRSYTRGLDLSGSLEGAGGIGGLLALSQPVVSSSNPSTFTAANYFYDGNGNVIDLVGDDGSEQAHYQYSPFGDRISATGPLADVNPYQFSTKERDLVTGFYYYGQRYYNPGTGRWLSRDPIEEQGGVNLYAFVRNDAVDHWDYLGLDCDCDARKKKLELRKQIADQQNARLYGPRPPQVEGKPSLVEVSDATGTLAGLADFLASNAGYTGTAISRISAITFVIPYGQAVGNAVGQGLYGTKASYGGALLEVARQGAIFGGSAWVGQTMMKTPTPVTIIGGAVLVTGAVGIDAFNLYEDQKLQQDLKLGDDIQRGIDREKFLDDVQQLNQDIRKWNIDCGGK